MEPNVQLNQMLNDKIKKHEFKKKKTKQQMNLSDSLKPKLIS